MTARLIQFLAGLTRRERILIALVLFIALPAGLVQAVALPLLARNEAARAAVAEAEALQDWLRARQAELALLPAASENPQAATNIPPAGLSALEDSLTQAGLRQSLSLFTNPSGASVSLRFQSVGFTQLMPWLDDVERRMGYRVATLRLSRGDQANLVEAEIQLEPRP